MKKLERIVGVLLVLAFLALVFAACAVYVTERYWDGWRAGYRDAVEGFVRTADNTSSAAQSAAPSHQGEGYTLIPLTQEQADKLASPERADTYTGPDGAGGFDSLDKGDWERLAVAVYQEAGSDWISDETRRMVADVVLNRVMDDRFPDSIEEVLLQPWQYGRFCETGICWPERASQAGEQAAVERARRIAEEVLSGVHSALYGEGYVFQAEFGQGAEGFWQDGIYFGK